MENTMVWCRPDQNYYYCCCFIEGPEGSCMNRQRRHGGMALGPLRCIRQDSILSPVLNTVFIGHLFWLCHFFGGVQLNDSRTIFDGDFADDIALLSRPRGDFQQKITEL